MSASTTINLQHEVTAHPVIAGMVVLVSISLGIIAFNSFVGAAGAGRRQSYVKSSSAIDDAGNIDETTSNKLNVGVISSSTSSSNFSQNNSNTSVIVNGQSVETDQSGSIHKSFKSDDGKSTVSISVDNKQTITGDSE